MRWNNQYSPLNIFVSSIQIVDNKYYFPDSSVYSVLNQLSVLIWCLEMSTSVFLADTSLCKINSLFIILGINSLYDQIPFFLHLARCRLKYKIIISKKPFIIPMYVLRFNCFDRGNAYSIVLYWIGNSV